MDKTTKALSLVAEERKRQFALYGDQSGKSPYEFLAILGEEYGELCEAVTETYTSGRHPERGGKEKITKEAVHVAAVAVQLIEVLLKTTDSLYEHHGNLIDRDCISNQILDKWGCDPMYYASDSKCGEEARADAYVLATLAQARIVIPAEGGHDNA